MKMKNYYCGDGNNNQDDSTNEVAAPIVDKTNDAITHLLSKLSRYKYKIILYWVKLGQISE